MQKFGLLLFCKRLSMCLNSKRSINTFDWLESNAFQCVRENAKGWTMIGRVMVHGFNLTFQSIQTRLSQYCKPSNTEQASERNS